MRYLAVIILSLFAFTVCSAQKRVAITIDDVPFLASGADFETQRKVNEQLLAAIEAMQGPVAVFINGKGIINEIDHPSERLEIFRRWLQSDLVTLGNHSQDHLNHGTTDLKTFTEDVAVAEGIIKQHAPGKPLRYFRFPYNALGKDSIDQAAKAEYLTSHGYIVAPFTIESVDYAFNELYVNELEMGNALRADSIAEMYVTHTLQLFTFWEGVTDERYHRDIPQIYLCHDNALNARCYNRLMTGLKERGYSFITLDEAMRDSVYSSELHYHGKGGMSWLYRWMPDGATRRSYGLKEPTPAIYEEYLKLQESKK